MKRKVSLGTDEISNLVKEVENYRDSLNKRCVLFLQLLAEEGITVAERRKGNWTSLVFTKTIRQTASGASGTMDGYGPIQIVQWQTLNGIRSEELSPILMAEFGSGQYASDARNRANKSYAPIVGAGRGTFPNQTHANEDSWSWMDLNGEWHTSSGLRPTMPMYYAARKMRAQIRRIGRRAFRT